MVCNDIQHLLFALSSTRNGQAYDERRIIISHSRLLFRASIRYDKPFKIRQRISNRFRWESSGSIFL